MEIKRCCFTGHRPEKLNVTEKEAKKLLNYAIKKAIDDGFSTFITGMARGIDIWAGEIVLGLKRCNPDIYLICTPPYKGFESRWTLSEQKLYNKVISQADYIKYTSEHYSKNCFQIRNIFMVNHSKRVIAFYNGTSGGTRNTINYANRKGIEVMNIFDG